MAGPGFANDNNVKAGHFLSLFITGALWRMINLNDNELLIRCRCHSNEHIALLVQEPDEGRGDPAWYLSVLLDPVRPWWKRLWRALWSHSGRYGMYAELVLQNQDARQIAEFICRRLDGAP